MTTSIETNVRDRLYVGGEWIESAGAETISVVNPATEEEIARVPAGTAEDVDRAVAAAREAFDGWAARACSDMPTSGHQSGMAMDSPCRYGGRLMTRTATRGTGRACASATTSTGSAGGGAMCSMTVFSAGSAA